MAGAAGVPSTKTAAGLDADYHEVMLGRTPFIVHKRYQDLVPLGRGAYGLVASAWDSLTNRKVRERGQVNFGPANECFVHTLTQALLPIARHTWLVW